MTTGIDFFNLHQLTIDDIVAKCNAANEGLCQKSVCMVDVSMIPNVWHIIKAGHDFIIENGFKHASGFDRETTCHFDATAVAGAGASAAVSGDESAVVSSNNRAQAQFNGRETECCGSQPFRKPYRMFKKCKCPPKFVEFRTRSFQRSVQNASRQTTVLRRG